LIFAFIPPKTPQSSVIKAIAGAEVPLVFMNGAVFGVFGYFSGYLTNITAFSWNTVSLILLVYGLIKAIAGAEVPLQKNAA